MREIGVLDSEIGIKNVFSEIYELSKKCKFLDCTHINEPGCAVLMATQSGALDKHKYDNYIKLLKENEYHSMTKLEKREKYRKFDKFIKTAKKQIKKYKF
jgi:ribosome biogenesis GTPase